MAQHDKDQVPEGSKFISIAQNIEANNENDGSSVASKEIITHTLDNDISSNRGRNTCLSVITDPTITQISYLNEQNSIFGPSSASFPMVIVERSPMGPITNQPIRISSNLPSPASINILTPCQPQSLFLLALAKLNESSLSLAIANNITINLQQQSSDVQNSNKIINLSTKSPELTTPDSLASAPPSYSFVLRQMAARRRPRLMGTFIPSPSFVQHTPPPNYATAFDIYVDNPIPPPTTRVYNYGFTPMPVVCPECGFTGMTVIASKITLCTHLCAIVLCLLCCWICAPLPYMMKSCKDVYHYCRNCRSFLGIYCPTNPESAYA